MTLRQRQDLEELLRELEPRLQAVEQDLGYAKGQIRDVQSQVEALQEARLGDALIARLPTGGNTPPPRNPPLLLIDLDGVVADYNLALWRRLAGQSAQILQTPLFEEWDWPSRHFTPAYADAVVTSLATDGMFWEDLLSYEWTDALFQVVELGRYRGEWEVVFLTARPDTHEVREATEFWLEAWGWYPGQNCQLAFTGNKGQWARGKDVLLAVDDNPDQLAWYHQEGVPAGQWLQPWNQGTTIGGVTRLTGVEDLTQALTGALTGRLTGVA